ncbi:MAG: protein kinase [Candidatus Riflebacteria bacterium]|nr:protein kinase [Candidatus Riflebacteria bacterium]
MIKKLNCTACGISFEAFSFPLAQQLRCPNCASMVDSQAGKELEEIGGYRLFEMLGQGGMGQVFRAEAPDGKRYALKVMAAASAESPELQERFEREMSIMASLDHENIVRLVDRGTSGSARFFVMELVEGTTLRHLIRMGKLTNPEIVNITCQALIALQHAHSHGVVHRDIKPENILITNDGQVKVTDFGLARQEAWEGASLTKTNAYMGTENYMSPEQKINPKGVTTKTDIYSLGVVLYEMLSGGMLPFGVFQPPSAFRPVDEFWDRLTFRLLDLDPSQRPASCEEVLLEIRDFANRPVAAPPGEGEAATAAGAAPAGPTPWERLRGLLAAVGRAIITPFRWAWSAFHWLFIAPFYDRTVLPRVFFERHAALFFAVVAILVTSVVFFTGSLQPIDDHLLSMVYQFGYQEDERLEDLPRLEDRRRALRQASPGDPALAALEQEIAAVHARQELLGSILLVKKDEKSSVLLGRNPGRPEFAAAVRFLAQPRLVDIGDRAVARTPLVDLRFGRLDHGPDGLCNGLFGTVLDALRPAGSPAPTPIEGEEAPRGLFRCTDTLGRLFPDFLGLPTADLLPLPAAPPAAATRETAAAWDGFWRSLLRSSLGVQVKVLPRGGVLLQVTADLSTDLGQKFEIPPAGLVAFDFLLQGAKLKEEDEALTAAVAAAQSPILLAGQLEEEDTAGGFDLRVREAAPGPGPAGAGGGAEPAGPAGSARPGGSEGPSGSAGSAGDSGRIKATFESTEILPEARFRQGTDVRVGYINLRPDTRGFVSRVPLFVHSRREGKVKPTFALLGAVLALDRRTANPAERIFERAMDVELRRIQESIGRGEYAGGVNLFDRFIPTDRHGNMELFFLGSTRGRAGHHPVFPSVSLYEALDAPHLLTCQAQRGGPPEPALEPAAAHARTNGKLQNTGGRICLVGAFERSDFDFYPTPVTHKTPFILQPGMLTGVEIHANALANILDRRYLVPADARHVFLFMVFGTILLGALLERFKPFTGTLLMVAFLGGAAWLSFHLYHAEQRLFPFSALLVSFPLTWACSLAEMYRRQKRQAGEVKGLFSRFVAPEVVQMLVDNPEEAKPGGQKKELTILFSDLAGFTAMSELLSAENLVVLMNEYLGAMTDLIFEHGGTLDKYLGDGILAYWNFPKQSPDHALLACRCCFAMPEKLRELQKGWSKRGLPRVYARVGINTAHVIVGCMGSSKVQMNFTCLGDGVNLASRLEGANKEFGTRSLISEATKVQVEDAVTTRFLDCIRVVGKKEVVRVFELVSETGREPPWWNDVYPLYQKGIELHDLRRWEEAVGVFESILRVVPTDGPSRTYLKRCQEYLKEPPPEGWDGSHALHVK